MHLAQRLQDIPPYLFMELRKKIAAARAAGVDVISLAVGDPVEPTPTSVVDELCVRAGDPANHPYPPDEEKGMLWQKSSSIESKSVYGRPWRHLHPKNRR